VVSLLFCMRRQLSPKNANLKSLDRQPPDDAARCTARRCGWDLLPRLNTRGHLTHSGGCAGAYHRLARWKEGIHIKSVNLSAHRRDTDTYTCVDKLYTVYMLSLSERYETASRNK
jgi:hypothetical protein